jgi:hypothetical protein
MPPTKKIKHPDALLYEDIAASFGLVQSKENALVFKKMLFDVRFVSDCREDDLYSDTLLKVANFLKLARKNIFSARRLLEPSKNEDFSLNVRRLRGDDFSDELEDIDHSLMAFIQACEKRHVSHGRGLKKSSLAGWATDIAEKFWSDHLENGKKLDKQKRAFIEKVLDHCGVGKDSKKSGTKSAVLRVEKVKKIKKNKSE